MAILMLTCDASAAVHAAELLLPLLPEPQVRALVGELHRRFLAGSIECLDIDFDPPPGLASWGEHPAFKESIPLQREWLELIAEADAHAEVVRTGHQTFESLAGSFS